MSEKKILLYTLSTCSHCKATKRLLTECNVEYDNITVDELEGETRQQVIQNLKLINPRCSFPTIKIDEAIIVGYKENQIKEALGL